MVTGRTTLGSAPGAQVRIADREVSRLHAELEPTDRGTWVRDLGSRNGTFVENLQVAAAMLPDGARIRVGGTDVVLRYPAEASPVELWPKESFGGLIGASTPMRELFAQMSRVAQSDAPALILGETGTGKELVARAIHDASARASGPFVIVDCAALASSLIEGELFGHARGAFTGAVSARAGSFEAANGGTIFLDEIGELPPALQPKLLRVLESRTSSAWARASTGRSTSGWSRRRTAICAAWSTPARFARTSTSASPCCRWCCPPLRARKEDIPLLFNHFLGGPQDRRARVGARAGRHAVAGQRSRAAEFRRTRMCAIGAKEALQSSHGSEERAGSAGAAGTPAVAFEQPFKEFRERWIDHGEREYLRRLLERHGRNVPAAAEEAGLDRTYVYRLIRKHGL